MSTRLTITIAGRPLSFKVDGEIRMGRDMTDHAVDALSASRTDPGIYFDAGEPFFEFDALDPVEAYRVIAEMWEWIIEREIIEGDQRENQPYASALTYLADRKRAS